MKLFTRRTNDNRITEVTKADRVWLHSMMKRQRMVLEDLEMFMKLYPDKLDREIVGSLFSVYEMLRDNAESIAYGRSAESIDRYYDVEDYRDRQYR